MSAIVQQKTAVVTVTGASPYNSTIALDAAPNPNALVVTVWSGNKQVPSVTAPTGFTQRGSYTGASVTGRSATGTGQQSAAWQWTGTANTHNFGALGIFETDIIGGVVAEVTTVPSPANDTNVATITADLGAAEATGTVFAIVGVDSSYDLISSPWPNGSTVTWSNGYTQITKVQQDTNTGATASGANANGVAFIIAKRDVVAGDSTAVTVSWSGGSPASIADQAYLTLIRVETPTAVTYTKTGAAAARVAGSGPKTVTSATVHTKTGAAAAHATGSGAKALAGAATLLKAGGAAVTPAGAGAKAITPITKTGGALAGAAAAGAKTVVATVHTKTGGGAARGAGSGPKAVTVAPTLATVWLGLDAIAVKTTGGTAGYQVRVAFSTSSAMTTPVYSPALVTPDAAGISKHAIPTLTPDTPYWYRVEAGGALIGTAQAFRSLPAAAAQTSFSFGFASCRNHTGDAPILANAISRGVDFFLITGDLHYRDINSNDQSLYQAGFDEVYTRTNMATLLKSVPTGYVWDDHDYGPNASNRNSPGKPAAQAVYRNRVPSPALPSASSVYHTFVIGRVRFIMLDARSERSPVGDADNSSKTMLGTEQKTWLQNLLATITEPLTCVISPVGWVSAGSDDDWGFYQTERTQIGSWITAAASRTKVVMLCGDMHSLAIDDGSHAVAGTPTYHAAPLNQTDNGVKGGTYSGGTFYSASQYGLMEVTDSGTSVAVKYSGIKSDGTVWNTHTTTASTTAIYIDTGAAAGRTAGSGAKSVTSAAVHAKTGGAAARAAVSGTKVLTPATAWTKGGSAAAASAVSGAKSVTSASVHARTGGAAAASAGSGSAQLAGAAVHARAGGAAANGAAAGQKLHQGSGTIAKAGGGGARAAGSGQHQVQAPAVIVKTGGAGAPVVASGTKVVIATTFHSRSGAAVAYPVIGGTVRVIPLSEQVVRPLHAGTPIPGTGLRAGAPTPGATIHAGVPVSI